MKSSIPSAPDLINYVIGVRAWSSNADEYLHSNGGVWLPGPNKAVCTRHATHDAPVHECMCGLYAYHSLSNFETNHIYGDVFGAVMAWGRMCVARDGFRSEYAQVVALSAGPSVQGEVLLEDGTAYQDDKRYERLNKIADAYDVPLVQFHELEEYALNFGDFIPLEMRPGKARPPTKKAKPLKGVVPATKPTALPATPMGALNPVTSNTMQAQAHGLIPAPVGYQDTPTMTFISGQPHIPRQERPGEDFAGLAAFVCLIGFVVLLASGSLWAAPAFLASIGLAKYAQ